MTNTDNSQNNTKWYVITTHSGAEESVKQKIEKSIADQNLENDVEEIYLPVIQKEELQQNKVVVKEKSRFSGYLFLKINLTRELWSLITGTPQVMGFIGDKSQPKALTPREFKKMVENIEKASKRVEQNANLAVGDAVRINEGSFSSFDGTITQINVEKKEVTVAVSIFNRLNHIDLLWSQVDKKQEQKSDS